MKPNLLTMIIFTASTALLPGEASAENLINKQEEHCITDAVKDAFGSASLLSIDNSSFNPRNYALDYDTANVALRFGSSESSVTINGEKVQEERIYLYDVSIVARKEGGDSEVVQQAKEAIVSCFSP